MALKKPSDLFGKKETSGVFETPEVSPHITESYNKFVDNFETVNEITEKTKVFEKVDELSERIEFLSKELSEKLTRTDLENAMLSQLMVLDENFKTIQSQVKGLNKEDLREFRSTVSSLSQVVDNLVETELPKYKNQLVKSKVFVGEQVQELQGIVEENITGIREEIDEKFDSIAEVIDNNLEHFSNQLQETSSQVKKTVDTYNKISKIVENKVSKENEKLEEYSQIIESLTQSFEELSYALKKELDITSQLSEEKFEEYKTQFENISTGLEKSVDNRLDSYRKELVDVKAEVAINEQHIKNVDKYLQEHYQDIVELKEEVFTEIEKLPVGNLQENIKRLEKKIDYIKETYSKIEPEVIVKEVIKEGLLNEPPETNNDDPLTPLDQNFVTLDQLQQHYRLFLNRIQQQLSTLGGGGETRLEFLDDVDRNSAKQNGYVLQYDSSVGKFIGTSYVPGGGGGGESYWVSTTAGIHTLSNVGIGTTNPTTALFVEGDARITGILSVGQGTVTINGITNTVNVDNLVVGTTFTGPGGVGYATVGYVTQQISNLVDGAPGALDTLNELAAALNDDENFATTVTNSLALKAPIDNANLTGVTTTPLLNVGVGGTIITTTGIGSVGIGSTLPGSTLVVNAPSGYSGNVLDVKRTGDTFSALTLSRTGGGFRGSANAGTFGFSEYSAYLFYIGVDLQFHMSNHKFSLEDEGTYAWSSTTDANGTADLTLYRDSANVLALRGGVNGGNTGVGQTFRIYNTYTSASQYERAYLGWNNNTFEIGVGTAGVSTARSISLVGAAGSNTGDTLQPLQINQTWTAGTGIATALTLNVTDTSSSSSSKLLDLRSSNASRLSVNKLGRVVVGPSTPLALGGDHTFYNQFGNNQGFSILDNSGSNNANARFSYYGMTIWGNSSPSIGFGPDNGVPDAAITRDSANVLAQRRSGIGQTFRIYNTYTSSTNFERANVGWTTNTFIVGTEKGSAGGSARQLELQTDGTTRVAITTTGNVGIGTTNPDSSLVVSVGTAYTGNVLDIKQGNSSIFRIATNENDYGTGAATTTYNLFSQLLNIRTNSGTTFLQAGPNSSNGIILGTNLSNYIGINNGILINAGGKIGELYIDSDLVIAQRSGIAPTSPNTYRIYNTYTSNTNYERGKLEWSGNVFNVGTEKGSAGGTARNLHLQTDGTTRVAITTDGNVGIGSTQPTATLDVVGDVRVGVDTSQGLILTSPNGTKFRLSIDDSGNITSTPV